MALTELCHRETLLHLITSIFWSSLYLMDPETMPGSRFTTWALKVPLLADRWACGLTRPTSPVPLAPTILLWWPRNYQSVRSCSPHASKRELVEFLQVQWVGRLLSPRNRPLGNMWQALEVGD